MKKIYKLFPFTFILLALIVFKNWFFLNPLSSGDWSYNFSESIKTFTIFPYSWFFNLNAGLGGASHFILSLSSYFLFTASILFNLFKIPWVLIERLLWFWPFLIISVLSSYFLFKKLFTEKFALLSSFIFLFNTYILMIVGGGQMGIAIAYSIVPLVLYVFIEDINSFSSLGNNFQFLLLSGLLLSVLVFFDIRVAYICVTAVSLYLVLSIKYKVSTNNFLSILNLIFYSLIIPGITAFFLNSFWISPLIAGGKNPLVELGSVYSFSESVKFFSFAKFEDAISLLHPNWPENIFGKTYFMRPEFLLLPILAFSSLFFVSKTKDQKSKTYILFFALLGIIGAFLAKGANEPFGQIYLWLFNNFPGFIMFRDPTKWYTLVAISYSILIPFSIYKIYEFLESQPKFQISNFKFQIKSKNQILKSQNIFLIFTVLYLLFLMRPAILGQLTGTFKPTTIPSDYIKLEQFLSSQNNFFRTLWVPTPQRFGFYSDMHPAISAQDFFKSVDYSQIFKEMKMYSTEVLLQGAGVKYVIVPFDSKGEIFLKDRKYDDKLYQQAVKGVSEILWLKPVDCSIAKLLNCSGNPFGRIAVFEVPNPKDHFYFGNQKPTTRLPKPGTDEQVSNQQIKYRYISPVEYRVILKNVKKSDVLVFSESYDAGWIAKNSEFRIQSLKYNQKFNSFVLPKDGNYTLRVYYTPQDYVNTGAVISGFTLMLVLGALIYLKKKKV